MVLRVSAVPTLSARADQQLHLLGPGQVLGQHPVDAVCTRSTGASSCSSRGRRAERAQLQSGLLGELDLVVPRHGCRTIRSQACTRAVSSSAAAQPCSSRICACGASNVRSVNGSVVASLSRTSSRVRSLAAHFLDVYGVRVNHGVCLRSSYFASTADTRFRHSTAIVSGHRCRPRWISDSRRQRIRSCSLFGQWQPAFEDISAAASTSRQSPDAKLASSSPPRQHLAPDRRVSACSTCRCQQQGAWRNLSPAPPRLNLGRQIRLLAQRQPGLLPALAELLAVVGVPGAGLADHPALGAQIDQLILPGDARHRTAA